MATSADDSTPSPNLDSQKSTSTPGKDKSLPLITPHEDAHAVDGASLRSAEGEDILARQALDPALNSKMHLVNNVSFLSSALDSFFTGRISRELIAQLGAYRLLMRSAGRLTIGNYLC